MESRHKLPIAIVGGGVGGLTAAVALRKFGREPVVFERTRQYGLLGADINLMPNPVCALDGLGVGDRIGQNAGRPDRRLSRRWDTGEVPFTSAMRLVCDRLFELVAKTADVRVGWSQP